MAEAEAAREQAPVRVVAVGASAGGLDACASMLRGLPAEPGVAFVIVLHLAPDRESHLAEVLATRTTLPVVQVTEARRIEPNCVYVVAPNTALRIVDGELLPEPLGDGTQELVDTLFVSLAKDQGEDAVAVVLSGLGFDGSAGVVAVHDAGGLCIAQEPSSAEHDAMPSAAIATGAIDAILPPEQIVAHILGEGTRPRPQVSASAASGQTESGFFDVLQLLSREYGLTTSDYKVGTLRRRAERRLAMLALPGWHEYRLYLEKHPDELAALYEDVLVGVTQFFRDPEQWAFLEREIIPGLIDEHDERTGPLRIWSAGCATGEEAYSLAMIFHEALERRSSPIKLQVFATDLSYRAIAAARHAVYPASVAEEVSSERLVGYFTQRGESFQVKRGIRDLVTLARHDLLSEPPFSRIDLIVCRNLFIYLEASAQFECLQRFHFALRPKGLLWLGGSESINRQNDLFATVSAKHRLYVRSDVHRTDSMMWSLRAPRAGGFPPPARDRIVVPAVARDSGRLTRMLEQYVLERYAEACVVVNEAGNVLHLFGPTSRYLSPPHGEVRLDILSWVHDSALYAKLRPGLRRALEERESVTLDRVEIQREGESVELEIRIDPIPVIATGLFLLVFREHPSRATLLEPGTSAHESEDPLVRRLADQLHEAQVELQQALEELDSTNEEYRASYEELVSLNEELQSSNEELETAKEEAQSINEELLTVNRELEDRNEALHVVNADLENLLALTTIPTVFLDRELRVRRFTPAVERVMWLVPSDISRPARHIRTRVDDPTMLSDAAQVLETLSPSEAEVRADDGRWYLRRIVPFRSGDRIDGVCLIFYDITAQKLATEQREEVLHVANAIVRTAAAPFVVFDHELHVLAANDAFFETFAVTRERSGADDDDGRPIYEDVAGLSLRELGDGEWDIAPLRELLEGVIRTKAGVAQHSLEHEFTGLGLRHLQICANLLERPRLPPLVLVSIVDLTALHEAQVLADARTRELEQEHRRKDEFLAMLGHELRNPLAALVNGLTLLDHVGDDAAQRAKILPILTRQTRRMTVMLDQLLDLSRVSSGKIEIAREPVDLDEVVAAAVEAVQPMIDRARHHLSLELPPRETAIVCGDFVRLVQVVENLLSNAAKYTDDGGEIAVEVAVEDALVRIHVRDSGVGIEPELIGEVFEVFTQGTQSLARSKGGLGLGLPLVRQLVDMHGGQVEARSAGYQQGSEFVVTLPRLVDDVVALEHEGQSVGLGLGAIPPRRVLIVDDERDAASTLAELLHSYGHEPLVAFDGRSALEMVGGFGPEVVLLDLGLPDIDGYEVARQLRLQFGGGLRIIALSGYPPEPSRLRDAGFDEHVIKPPRSHRLAAVLAKA